VWCSAGCLAANLIAVGLLLVPHRAGHPKNSKRQYGASLRSQLHTQQRCLSERASTSAQFETGRGEGDQFLSEYFLPDRSAFQALLTELDSAASKNENRPREHAYSTEPVEGSDSLNMMTITAAL